MKKKLMLFIILVFLIPLTYGCGQDNLGDDYIEGSDYQYMLDNQLNSGCTKARGENGYFFLQGHYIYYLDDNTHSLVALCNKADCLHNGETDSDRYSDCNAYLEVGADTIAYCNGYLYVLDSADSNPVLYRIKEDGSKREVVKKWEEENVCIDLWSIHRDVFYYVERTYAVEDGEVVQHYAVMKMTIGKGSSSSPVCIYEQPDGVYLSSIGTIRAYGNYVYFMAFGTIEGTDSGEDSMDDVYYKLFVYNIQDESINEIISPAEGHSYFSGVTFWNGRIILCPNDMDKEIGDSQTVYIADLDGTNMEVFLEDAVYGNYYSSDGTYLYISNFSLAANGIEDCLSFEVYDEEMEPVDSFTTPFTGYFNLDAGREDGIYFWTYSTETDESGSDEITTQTLQWFDKSTLGTYHGEEFVFSSAAVWDAAPADGT